MLKLLRIGASTKAWRQTHEKLESCPKKNIIEGDRNAFTTAPFAGYTFIPLEHYWTMHYPIWALRKIFCVTKKPSSIQDVEGGLTLETCCYDVGAYYLNKLSHSTSHWKHNWITFTPFLDTFETICVYVRMTRLYMCISSLSQQHQICLTSNLGTPTVNVGGHTISIIALSNYLFFVLCMSNT